MSKRLTTQEFIERAKKTHSDRFNYDKVKYIDTVHKVIITCKVHGDFYQSPMDHIRGKGCSKCSGKYSPTTEEFIEKARKVHGDKYDYSKTIYVRALENVIITCKIHGDFNQTPDNHLHGKGCSKCQYDLIASIRRRDFTDVIKQANHIHSNKYDYSLIKEYKNNSTKYPIICSIHGIFYQHFGGHLSGRGCDKCGGSYDLTTDDFIKKSKEVHGDKYDYSKSKYIKSTEKVIIGCLLTGHGYFEQLPSSHMQGAGCQKCSGCYSPTNEEFVNMAKLVHNNFYNYDKVVYKNTDEKIIISCPIHGDFKQTPFHHLEGCGCPICNASRGEKLINKILNKYNINFEVQKTFSDCKYKEKLKFDFYIPSKNILVEYDGIQHFELVERYGGEEGFRLIQIRDDIKNKYCEDNNMTLIRLPYWLSYEEVEEILINDINNN